MESSSVQLVGYDGSPLSELALHRALEGAVRAETSVVHVVAVAQHAGDLVRMPDGLVVDPWAGLLALRLTLAELLRTWQLLDQQVRVVAHVATGEAGPTLVDVAARLEATSITVGLRGSSSRPSRVGSVAEYVARNASCAVHLESLLATREGPRPGDPLRLYLALGDGFTTPGTAPSRMARA